MCFKFYHSHTYWSPLDYHIASHSLNMDRILHGKRANEGRAELFSSKGASSLHYK